MGANVYCFVYPNPVAERAEARLLNGLIPQKPLWRSPKKKHPRQVRNLTMLNLAQLLPTILVLLVYTQDNFWVVGTSPLIDLK